MGSLMNQVFYTDAYDLSIVSLIVAVFAVAIVAWVVWELAQVILRHMIGKEYSVRVPFSVRVGLNRRHSPDGFSMGYPYWQAAKKDGTRDLRTNNTRIVRTPTVIFLGGWRLSVRNPFTAYDFVNDLRDAGHDLGRCPEEQWKLRCLTERERARSEATSIDGIVNRFRDHPTDFEPFCADLFHTLGWRAETTPPSRDGGFDLRMISPEGETYIAECKCYSPRHHVGRPVVQKLHGANRRTGARHDAGDDQLVLAGRRGLCRPGRRRARRRFRSRRSVPSRVGRSAHRHYSGAFRQDDPCRAHVAHPRRHAEPLSEICEDEVALFTLRRATACAGAYSG